MTQTQRSYFQSSELFTAHVKNLILDKKEFEPDFFRSDEKLQAKISGRSNFSRKFFEMRRKHDEISAELDLKIPEFVRDLNFLKKEFVICFLGYFQRFMSDSSKKRFYQSERNLSDYFSFFLDKTGLQLIYDGNSFLLY